MNEIDALTQTSIEDTQEYDVYELAQAVQMVDSLSLAEVLWEEPEVASKLQKAIDVIEQEKYDNRTTS